MSGKADRTKNVNDFLCDMEQLAPLYMVCGLFMLACTAPEPPPRAFTSADDTAIREVMADQERAWDRGDIPGFMEGYADSICFISLKGKSCGKAAVTAHYVKTYPDKAAMGDLSFGQLEILGAGANNAWATGTWKLVRAADTLGGGFSLFWQRMPQGRLREGASATARWRIVRDHTY